LSDNWHAMFTRITSNGGRSYARAAAWILGADRWSEARWEEMERQLAMVAEQRTPPPPPQPPRQPSTRRRMVRSSYMG